MRDITDEQLSAELKKWTGAMPALHPVGELLDRHWEAAFAYALLCADGPRAAGMLTTAAFTRLFGASLGQAGPESAWRPQLLVTVRRIAAEWDGDGRQEMLHPALRTGTGPGDRAAARLLPPAHRRLLARAFQQLPQSFRAVLWHTEIESEPLAVPARLLGLDEDDARVELDRARERLREECLQIHRELAPQDECLRYLRMLDVTYRRGPASLDPDLRGHLDGCRHCLHTADQLAQFNGGLPLALAEAVLGWGAQDYLDSRAGLPQEAAEPRSADTRTEPDTRPAPRSARRAARRGRRRDVALAVTAVSGLVVLPLVAWAVLGSDDGASPSAARRSVATPGGGYPTSAPSWIGSKQTSQGTLHGRLRNAGSGLCVGVTGGKAVKGAETELAKCSSAPSEQWTYDSGGLLHNAAAPGLCLDSHLGYSLPLAPCTGASRPGADNVRYDFTFQGTLVPRWNEKLALAPAATDGSGDLVVKIRMDTDVQRWVIDSAKPDPQMQAVDWDGRHTPTATPSARSLKTPAPTPSATRSSPSPTDSPTDAACAGYSCNWQGGYGGWGSGSGYGRGFGGPGYGRR